MILYSYKEPKYLIPYFCQITPQLQRNSKKQEHEAELVYLLCNYNLILFR